MTINEKILLNEKISSYDMCKKESKVIFFNFMSKLKKMNIKNKNIIY
jgi:hypothetical protein